MFGWLGLALFIDGIDGPLARRFRVRELLPNWSGDALDFVVDFITYVFVPALVIAESDLVWKPVAVLLAAAVVTSSALYFADSRMKTADNYFRGFPAIWNAAVLTLFVMQWPPVVASLVIVAFIVLTFVPVRVLHPMRVVRGRMFNIGVTLVWSALAAWGSEAGGLDAGVVAGDVAGGSRQGCLRAQRAFGKASDGNLRGFCVWDQCI